MNLNKELIKGIARAVFYYAVGFALVRLTYLVFGWEYVHAPGLHHMVGLLVLVIGAVLLIRRIIGAFTEPRDSRNNGTMLVHALAVLGFILYFKLDILNGAIKRDTGDPFPSKTLTTDSQTKALLLSNSIGDTLLHQVADSVHLDRE